MMYNADRIQRNILFMCRLFTFVDFIYQYVSYSENKNALKHSIWVIVLCGYIVNHLFITFNQAVVR